MKYGRYGSVVYLPCKVVGICVDLVSIELPDKFILRKKYSIPFTVRVNNTKNKRVTISVILHLHFNDKTPPSNIESRIIVDPGSHEYSGTFNFTMWTSLWKYNPAKSVTLSITTYYLADSIEEYVYEGKRYRCNIFLTNMFSLTPTNIPIEHPSTTAEPTVKIVSFTKDKDVIKSDKEYIMYKVVYNSTSTSKIRLDVVLPDGKIFQQFFRITPGTHTLRFTVPTYGVNGRVEVKLYEITPVPVLVFSDSYVIDIPHPKEPKEPKERKGTFGIVFGIIVAIGLLILLRGMKK